ncbi:MAG: hypothetical protein HN922_13865 [Anaerolineae bacterium]|nr:hypothetical protein [Anaerolineae bacterium]
MTSYRTRINKIADQLDKLGEIENPTNRDVAQAIELQQQHCDILEELEDADFKFENGVLIKVGDESIKFENVNDFLDFAVGVMNE